MKGISELTEQDRVYLEKYANEGKSDKWISETLNIRRDLVGSLTTAYWKRKTNNNHNK